MAAALGVDLLAPGGQLPVEVGHVRKRAPWVEVILDEGERSFGPAFAIGIAHGVGHKRKAEPLAERLHLRGDDRLPPGSVGDHDAGIVDHASSRGSAQEQKGFGQEDLGVEPVEGRITPGEEHPRVAQDQSGALQASFPLPDRHIVGGGVVLHLLPRLEVVRAGALLLRDSDSVAAHEAGQRLIRDRGPRPGQLLPHPHPVPLALAVQIPDRFQVWSELLGTRNLLDCRAPACKHPAHCVAGDAHGTGNGAHPVTLWGQGQDCTSPVSIQQGAPP